MSVILISKGDQTNKRNKSYYKVKCPKCKNVYVITDDEIVEEYSPGTILFGITILRNTSYFTCPECNTRAFRFNMNKLTKTEYDQYVVNRYDE